MTLPNTVQAFVRFMEDIWAMPMEACPNGVVISKHPDYDQFHDAIATARKCGMVRTGSSGEFEVYRFADDPFSGAKITRDGSAVAVTRQKFGRKR